MPGATYESVVNLRYGKADTTTFVARALGILDSRVGTYRGHRLQDSLIVGAELELARAGDLAGLRWRTGTESRAAAGLGEGAASSGVLTIEPDPRSGLRLAGLGPEPLPLRRGNVDAVRCATFVFGFGDIEGGGTVAEFGLTLRVDAGLQCAYAYGTPKDPYTLRWEFSVRPVAVVERERGRALPESAAIGLIAAQCLAG